MPFQPTLIFDLCYPARVTLHIADLDSSVNKQPTYLSTPAGPDLDHCPFPPLRSPLTASLAPPPHLWLPARSVPAALWAGLSPEQRNSLAAVAVRSDRQINPSISAAPLGQTGQAVTSNQRAVRGREPRGQGGALGMQVNQRSSRE